MHYFYTILFLLIASPLSAAQIKAVIFDCDGTLVESEMVHFRSWRLAALDFGYDLNFEEYKGYIGKAGSEIAQSLADKAGNASACKMIEQKRIHTAEIIKNEKSVPIPGTVDFLHRLASAKDDLKLKLAVASAGSQEHIHASLKSLGIDHYFDIILSGESDLTEYSDPEGVNKPKPYIYIHAAKLFGIHPSECLVIEDSRTGVMAGVRAGCYTIAVPNIFTQHQDLSEAHETISSLHEVSVEELLEKAE